MACSGTWDTATQTCIPSTNPTAAFRAACTSDFATANGATYDSTIPTAPTCHLPVSGISPEATYTLAQATNLNAAIAGRAAVVQTLCTTASGTWSTATDSCTYQGTTFYTTATLQAAMDMVAFNNACTVATGIFTPGPICTVTGKGTASSLTELNSMVACTGSWNSTTRNCDTAPVVIETTDTFKAKCEGAVGTWTADVADPTNTDKGTCRLANATIGYQDVATINTNCTRWEGQMKAGDGNLYCTVPNQGDLSPAQLAAYTGCPTNWNTAQKQCVNITTSSSSSSPEDAAREETLNNLRIQVSNLQGQLNASQNSSSGTGSTANNSQTVALQQQIAALSQQLQQQSATTGAGAGTTAGASAGTVTVNSTGTTTMTTTAKQSISQLLASQAEANKAAAEEAAAKAEEAAPATPSKKLATAGTQAVSKSSSTSAAASTVKVVQESAQNSASATSKAQSAATGASHGSYIQGKTGPEVMLYPFFLVGANGMYYVWRKKRKA